MDSQLGQVTILDFLALIILEMPVIGVVVAVKEAGGGALRYVVGAPLGLIAGLCLFLADWYLNRCLWLRAQKFNQSGQNTAAIALFVVKLLLVAVGAIAGERLGQLIVHLKILS